VPPRRPSSPPPATSVAPEISDDDRRLLEREYAGVKPLSGPKPVPRVPGPSKPKARIRERAPIPTEAPALGQGQRFEWSASGVQRRALKALARGELGFESTCDLHGMTADLARRKLEQTVLESVRMGRRTLLVIFGRGLHSGPDGPVLPTVVVRSLAHASLAAHVLAYATAAPAHGGEGALTVLLKRRRDQR
jgi:DNA-nicking Smr family endonuclease